MDIEKIKELKTNGVLFEICDIFRTSPINTNYPNGFSCDACRKCNNECTYDSDGSDCNYAFEEYIEKELIKRQKEFEEREKEQIELSKRRKLY